MLKSLRGLFESAMQVKTSSPRHELAGMALLLEIARADHRHTPDELAAIVRAGAQVFGLSEAESRALLDAATQSVEDAVSLFEFTSTLNAHLDLPARRQLLTHLWKVAYADGAVDRYEEYYLRKIADLLHIGHRGLIQAKLAAEDS